MLDLLVWWLGVRTAWYEDDAMGALGNRRFAFAVRVGYPVVGRLSCDWEVPNRFFSIVRRLDELDADRTGIGQIGFHDTSFALDAGLLYRAVTFGYPIAGRKSINFEQAFIFQIRNVVDAMHGHASLVAPGTDALRSLRLIDECRRRRKLMNMGWLTETECAAARTEADQVR
jgi:hypothetical protein